jgi:hypothetical protein
MGRGASEDQDHGAVASRRGAVAYSAIENTGDRQLEDAIRSWLRCEPSELTFTRTTMSVGNLRGNFTEDPGLFLSDGDEEGYESVTALAEAYARGDDVPPVVIARDGDAFALLDGCHRMSGAWSAGISEVEAYVADRPVAN